MHRIVTAVAALVLALSATAAGPASAVAATSSPADPAAAVTADLAGMPIPVAEIANHYCFDRDFPHIHCFANAAALESARTASLAGTALGVAPAGATDYAVVYSGTYWSGSYLYISQNYDALAVVGWNDRIRSYHGLNNELGSYYTDWFAGGSRLDFCCNASIPTMAAGFDQTISSVYRR